MELVTHPVMMPLILSGQKTTNILNGMHKDSSPIKFITHDKEKNMETFAVADCDFITGIRVNAQLFRVWVLADGKWKLLNNADVAELVKSEGLKSKNDLYHRFPVPFQGTVIGWNVVSPVNLEKFEL